MNGDLMPHKKIIASLNKSSPALLVDADNVLLQFVARLESFFPTKGFELKLQSFQLQGNIYDLESGLAAPADTVKTLISSFFDDCVDDIQPVAGAAKSLEKLSEYYQILILSNVPERCRERRQASLAKLGMAYPVIANEGAKGPMVKEISKHLDGYPSVFIDDLPPHHTSVANHSPHTHRIHCVADKRLAGFLPKAPEAHLRADTWDVIEDYLLKRVGG